MSNRRIIQRNQFLLMTFVWGVAWSANSHELGQENDLQRRAHRRLSITWSGQSLNLALTSLADHEEVSVWLDRRVDPEQTIELVLQDVSYKEALSELARSCGMQVVYLGSIVYFGPREAAEEIMAIREKQYIAIKKSPKNLREYWFHKSAWSWPRLSEPRKLLQELFSESPIKLLGKEQIPYDLWDARQLPPLTRIDRATLLLIGFDLMLHTETIKRECRVVPIDRPVLITRQYPINASQRSAISQMHHKQNSRSSASDKQVYSLEIRELTLHKVLKQLASQLPVELTWDARQLATAGYSLDVRISCKVQSVSLEHLLEAILTPVGLHFQRVGKRILIVPAL